MHCHDMVPKHLNCHFLFLILWNTSNREAYNIRQQYHCLHKFIFEVAFIQTNIWFLFKFKQKPKDFKWQHEFFSSLSLKKKKKKFRISFSLLFILIGSYISNSVEVEYFNLNERHDSHELAHCEKWNLIKIDRFVFN